MNFQPFHNSEINLFIFASWAELAWLTHFSPSPAFRPGPDRQPSPPPLLSLPRHPKPPSQVGPTASPPARATYCRTLVLTPPPPGPPASRCCRSHASATRTPPPPSSSMPHPPPKAINSSGNLVLRSSRRAASVALALPPEMLSSRRVSSPKLKPSHRLHC